MHIYNTTGHCITGDPNINNNTSLRDMLDKEPKTLVDSEKDLLV